MIKRLLCIFAVVVGASASAQTTDFGMWNTLSLNKEFGKKFSVGIDQEVRLRDNLSTLNLIYTNVGATYKITDYFKVSLVYRFIDKHKDDLSWGIRHRAYIDLTFKAKPADFSISYRARFQSEWRGTGYDAEFGNVPEVFLRNSIKVGYQASDKIEPYVGAEVRWQIQNPRIPYHEAVDRYRLFGGLNYEINDHNTIGTYYLRQQEVNVIDRQTLNIWGLEYTINL